MSNQNMNISAKNVIGKCDLKCSYAFKYSESNSIAKNKGVMIDISYDSRNVPPVSYNNEKYSVSKIMIVSPSLHLFNNKTMPGEILIEHIPVKGGNNLKVCIPISNSSDSSSASDLITQVIEKVATNAPSDGDSTNLNFNLQNIVPRKPFFVYSHDSIDYIAYGVLDVISVTSSVIKMLQQIIKPFPIPMPSAPLFYNSKGPISGVQIGDGLYISCQPTGSTDEETEVAYSKNATTYDFSNILNNQSFAYFMMILVGCILFIIIFYGINAFYQYLVEDAPTVSFLRM